MNREEFCSSCVRTEGRHQLVRLDGDVGGRKTELAAYLITRLDRTGHRILATKHAVRLFNLSDGDEAPDLGAVQRPAFERKGWDHIDNMPVSSKPLRISRAPATEGEVVADHPTPGFHDLAEAIDEFLR